MGYKTVLVHVDDSVHAGLRLRLAGQIAQAHQAHLIGSAMSGLSRHAHPDGTVAPLGAPFPFDLSLLHARANKALAGFNDVASRYSAPSCETRLVDDDAEGGLIQQSTYADSLVMSQADPHAHLPGPAAELPQRVLFHSAHPVLIVPCTGRFEHVGDKVLLGWDGSMAATRAITGAMPLLCGAAQVTLAVLNPTRRRAAHGEQPGADLALYLARQGVTVEVLVQETELGTGAALFLLASQLGADLLVAGCYAHTRWREMILGGTTHALLQAMTLPVLMSH